MTEIDEICRGSIDMHVHFGPDSMSVRRMDSLETARRAADYGMKAIVLKSHDYPTAPLAQLVGQLVPQVLVFGSLCLDQEAGGFSIAAVDVSAKLGAKLVFMPTFTAANSMRKVSALLGLKLKGEPLSVLDTSGKLLPQVKEILKIIKDYNMVLATGHLSPREIFTLLEEAKKTGVSRIIITHALEAMAFEEMLSLEQHKQLASEGAFIEHCCYSILPTGAGKSPEETVEAIKTVGPDHCILSSDLGQNANPPAAEGMRIFIATMLKNGFSKHEVELMVKVNPSRLLGLS